MKESEFKIHSKHSKQGWQMYNLNVITSSIGKKPIIRSGEAIYLWKKSGSEEGSK